MHSLFIDLGSHKGSLACVRADSCSAFAAMDHRIGDDELLVHYEQMLKQAGWKAGDITNLACVTGPGGFTSLRVAVGFANALSYALDIPVAGVHLSDLYATRAQNNSFLWLHSTKKNEVFARGFGSIATNIPESVCFTLEKLEEVIKRMSQGCFWAGELLPEHRELITNLGLKEVPLRPLEDVLPGFLSVLQYSKENLLPWYGRGW